MMSAMCDFIHFLRHRITIILLLLGVLIAAAACSERQLADTTAGPKLAWQGGLNYSTKQNFWPLYAKRLQFSKTYAHNPSVQAQIAWFQAHPYYFQQLISQSEPYIYYINQQTVSRHLPAELALMPMIESAYDPFRYSKAGATGLWDLMPGTASGLGVQINWWYDGRRDLVESTRAALTYLSYLHQHLHDWSLAIPAYDAGAGLIDKAQRVNREQHLSTQLWSLNLPLETKAYLPKLLALANIIRDPAHYGFHIPFLANRPQFIVFSMKRQLNLASIAHMAGVSLTELRQLNPGFRRWATAPGLGYQCLIPLSQATLFAQKLAQLQPVHVLKWQRYQVQEGDNLSKIAQHFHTKLDVLRQVNHLQQGALLHTKQVLFIPTNATGRLQDMSKLWAHEHQLQHAKIHASLAEDAMPGPQQITYTVRPQDSLDAVAKHYHVRVSEILFWNRLRHRAHLHPGQVLVLWRKHGARLPVAHHVYHVKPGQSLYAIAHAHHLRLPALLKINPHLNPKHSLHPGQLIYY